VEGCGSSDASDQFWLGVDGEVDREYSRHKFGPRAVIVAQPPFRRSALLPVRTPLA